MRTVWIILTVLLIALLVGGLAWLGQKPARTASAGAPLPATLPATQPDRTLRLGMVPERDIFAQRRRFQALADYLSAKLQRPVKLVTVNSYQSVLQDFAEKQVDAAFLGSMVAVLTMDRLDAKLLLKTELDGGISSYCGVMFVPDGSSIRSIDDLAGHSIAMVRTTTGGNLYPMYELVHHGLLNGRKPPQIRWVGTHDDAIRAVMEGEVDAGAVKNLRLDAFEKLHPQFKVRRLGASEQVPENTLLVRGDVAEELGPLLSKLLLSMDSTEEGRTALAAYGAVRFLPCRVEEYKVIYDLSEALGPAWIQLDIQGPPPKRPPGVPRS